MRFLLILSVLLSVSSHATAQNLLADPSLELATGATLTSNSAWVASADGTSAQFQSAPWASNPRGSTDAGSVGFWFKSFSGNATATVNADLYQDVLVGPGEYSFGAFVYHELNFTAAASGLEAIAYSGGAGGTVTGMAAIDLLTTPTGPVSAGGTVDNFVEALGSISAGPGTDTIRIRAYMQDGMNGGIDPQSLLLDDFSLQAVPEPGTGFMAMFVVCCLGAFRKSR